MVQASARGRGGKLRSALRALRPAIHHADLLALSGAFACVMAGALLSGLAPVALKLMIDSLAGPAAPAGQASWRMQPAVLLFVYAGALGLVRLLGEVRTYLFGQADQSVSRRLSRQVFMHVLALPMRFHVRRETGAVVQTLENGLQGYRLVLQHGLFTLLPGLSELLVIAIVVASFLDAAILLVFATCLCAYGTVFFLGARSLVRASRSVAQARIGASARLADSLINIEAIKAAAGEPVITRRQDERLADLQTRWRAFHRARLSNGALVALVFTAGFGATLWLGIVRVQAGTMSVGDLVMVNAYLLQLVLPLERLGFGLRDAGQGVAYIERLLDLLGEPAEALGKPARPARPAGAPRQPAPASLQFEDVSFAYEDGQPVLDRVSFSVPPGSLTAIVGPSGAGKSSIMRLLMRFHEPDRGRILMDGIPLGDYPLAVLRQRMALISQDTTLFSDSLAFNIAFPDADLPAEAILRAGAMARLGGLTARLPQGYDTPVGERGLKLSGGERQRVAIARALLRRPALLLADEATAALDSRTEAEIAECLAGAADGTTTIMVAHRLSTIAGADQILVLEQGRVVERGRHEALVAAGGLYARMWDAQAPGVPGRSGMWAR